MAEETRNSENTTAESTTTKEETVKKENIIWKLCKYMIKGTGYLCLFLVPCLSYYLFEYVTGNLENISIFIGGFEYMLGLCIVPCTYRYYRNHKDICAGRVHCSADPFFCGNLCSRFS